MVYQYFDIRTSGGAATLARSEILQSETLVMRNKSTIKNEIMSNKELAEKLHKTIIKKFNERKVHSSFIDNIWAHI